MTLKRPVQSVGWSVCHSLNYSFFLLLRSPLFIRTNSFLFLTSNIPIPMPLSAAYRHFFCSPNLRVSLFLSILISILYHLVSVNLPPAFLNFSTLSLFFFFLSHLPFFHSKFSSVISRSILLHCFSSGCFPYASIPYGFFFICIHPPFRPSPKESLCRYY